MKEKSNVMIINQFASTPEYSTGAGERFYYLSKYFKVLGWETTVISSAFNHLFLKLPKTKGLYTEESFPYTTYYWVKIQKYKAESSTGRTLAFFEFLFKLFLFPIKKEKLPDVLVVSSMSIFPVFYAYYLKLRYKIPVVLEIRDIWPLTAIELGGYSGRHPFMKLLSYTENFGYRHADHLVSVLPGFGEYLVEKGYRAKKFTLIPNGAEISMAENNEDYHFNLPIAPFKVIYTGAIGTANAMDVFVNVSNQMKDNKDIHFIIVGEGPEKPKLKESTKSQQNITFINKVKKTQIHAILKKCDLGYIGWRKKKIYQYGVSANKYNDYMLAELPILSASGLEHDPVKKAECGVVVDAEKVDQIVEGILYFFNLSKEERKAIGKRGNEYVLKNQEYGMLANKYIEVFEEVLGNLSLKNNRL